LPHPVYYSALLFKQAAKTEDDMVDKLLDILLRRDDRLLPLFCDALKADRQPHIVELFRRNGTIHFLCTSQQSISL